MPRLPRALPSSARGWRPLVLLLLLGSGAAPSANVQAPAAPPCRQLSPTVFMLEGPTDPAMRDCVRDTLADSTTELVVRSGGGNIEAALDIADLLARPGLTVRVRGKCYSSCANYFLPLATRLVVEPGATIVQHGGVDPMFIAHERVERRAARIRERGALRPDLSPAEMQADYERAIEKYIELAERQRQFALRHGVGPGWFLYREPADSDFGRQLVGKAGRKPSLFGWEYLLVEEPMLRSCLPRVQVEPFQSMLEATFIGDRMRFARFVDAKGRRSLELRCKATGT